MNTTIRKAHRKYTDSRRKTLVLASKATAYEYDSALDALAIVNHNRILNLDLNDGIHAPVTDLEGELRVAIARELEALNLYRDLLDVELDDLFKINRSNKVR